MRVLSGSRLWESDDLSPQRGGEKTWHFAFYHEKQCLIKEWIWDVVCGNVVGLGLSSGKIPNESGQSSVQTKKNNMSRTLGYFGCPIKGTVHPEMKFLSSFTLVLNSYDFFSSGCKTQKVKFYRI